ncbi:MAG: ATP-dependent RNA helicase HrpA [Leptospirillia bacterium]
MDVKPPTIRERLERLRESLSGCTARDAHRIERRARPLADKKRFDRRDRELLERLEAEAARSAERKLWREQNRPRPSYPEDLPVSARRDEIAAAIDAHQVVVVAGETGSGKTTQLPKICLDAGRGVRGLIGHTQPRRIAARTLAERIASELATPLGHAVGYKVRFSDHTSPETFVKVMTDGILLAEVQGDPRLTAYDTLLIDEAHERSLNIDFLLGYIRDILPRRPDLKVVITSATIDTARFAEHFNAPVIEVSGRTYPVETRYRPPQDPDPDSRTQDPNAALLAAVDEAATEGKGRDNGDILVFLPGERDIREAAEALRKHHPPETEILPLYARLSGAEQARVFSPGHRRRIVLATNVAETSLTVPRIGYVVDTGLARISRYSPRAKVQRLPIEKISRASANQRQGRCGRVADGVCIRLYGEDDYLGRPEFTEPEIRRTNLAAVILRMLSLGLGDIAEFPFLDPPDRKQIADGFELLGELGAVDGARRITRLGNQLARFNVDPRLARMVLEARREDCLSEILTLAAALSVRDPRERPQEEAGKADAAHARFKDPHSDFSSLLKLWAFFGENEKHLSQNKLRKLCKATFISYLRMREWRDIRRELANQVKEMGFKVNKKAAGSDAIHRALLSGLLGHVGRKGDKKGTYTGARGIGFSVFPGSGLFKKPPEWIMAAELVETGRLYARHCARIDPAWIEQVGARLIRKSHFEPHWERRPAAVMAFERATLYGILLYPRRKVHYGPIDPETGRDVFIRQALVAGDFDTRAPFFAHNQGLVDEVENVVAKSRDRKAGVDEEALVAFYEARIPAGIHNGKTFKKWLRDAEAKAPEQLFMRRGDLLAEEDPETAALYPEHLTIPGFELPLSYRFQLGHADDGVTATVPLHALNALPGSRCEWLVPGMLRDKVGALLKGLPKAYRKAFMPWPHWAGRFAEAVTPSDEPITKALGDFLLAESGTLIPPEAWNPDALPDHLKMRFSVVDAAGTELGADRDLSALRERFGGHAVRHFEELPKDTFERDDVEEWDFELPDSVTVDAGGSPVTGYPSLTVEGDRVALRMFETPQAANAALPDGILALFFRQLPVEAKQLARLKLPQETLLQYAPLGTTDSLRADIARAVAARFVLDAGPIRTAQAFNEQVEAARGQLIGMAMEAGGHIAEALAEYHGLMTALAQPGTRGAPESLDDLKTQVTGLVYPGFVAHTPYHELPHLERYLRAAAVRLERMGENPARDTRRLAQIAPLIEAFAAYGDDPSNPDLSDFRWKLEELRVSTFAQEIGTAEKVSVKRLTELWREISA